MTATLTGLPVHGPHPAAGELTVRDAHDEVRRRLRNDDLTGAIRLLRQLVEAYPEVERLGHDLVRLLRLDGDTVGADRLAVRLDPTDIPAWARLSRTARRTKDTELFIEASIGWAAAMPEHPVVGHFAGIARSIHEGTDHERASDDYVRILFDGYADRFDGHLDELNYRGPDVVAGLVSDLVADGDIAPDADIADLGCGTGLVGQCLRDASANARGETSAWQGRLVGADLSSRMLEHTEARHLGDRPVYDEVAAADFETFLVDRPNSFDAVVAADALIYVGDLRPVVAAAATSLRPGGWLVATLERAVEPDAIRRGFAGSMTGRYLHADDWLHTVLTDAGFDIVVIDELSVRDEACRPVPGLVVVARHPG